jgi:uncharacterized protein
MNINQQIAQELNVNVAQVNATVALLNEGMTVPFIARYRKEATGSLDDTQLRTLEERLLYLRELEERRATILESIEKQDKLTPELKKEILTADNKARLEDLYLPYKPKRRTKAQIAIEAGLAPLADAILANPKLELANVAATYLNPEKEITTAEQALEGARHILLERFSEDADLLEKLRVYLWENAQLASVVIKDKEDSGAKFKDYFAYQEPLKRMPAHRILAVMRGQKEDVLRLNIEFADETHDTYCVDLIAKTFVIHKGNTAGEKWLWQTVEWTWKIKLKLKLDVDLMLRLKESAEEDAIRVFKDNLKNLLMAAPAGKFVTMGLDPGLRTGVKVVVVDDTGKLLAHVAIFPHVPQQKWEESLQILQRLCAHFKVNLISIGNGTASRETERLAQELAKRFPELNLNCVVVSEAGASVYSASELAAKEFPDLDVVYRGAVSIARRLQDPLAELVKIDPKSIGVGQYQHDVNQVKLGRSLNAVLEDCVNAVGADVNTASVPLLKSIAGLNETVAQNIVQYREQHGRFANREAIKKIPRLGDKTYEQAIGFLRIIGGENPLDASAVHPEAYPLVDQVLQKIQLSLPEIMGNPSVLKSLSPKDFVSTQYGLPTIIDVLQELQKPGRDPRPEFETVKFQEGIETLADLKVGMGLDGVVTNVTNFGAFVDIGVHQDGLVHVSQLADKFISDPNEVVKVGQIVHVKVVEVDLVRKRIQLTMKTNGDTKKEAPTTITKPSKPAPKAQTAGSFGNLLKDALKR